MKKITYSNLNTGKLLFPLGGIGTGCIHLSGNGKFINLDMFKNYSGKSSPLCFFAAKAEKDGCFEDAKLICSNFDFDNLDFIPHFPESEMQVHFPYAEKLFLSESFPCIIRMTAFNPFIPFNDSDSSIPAAFFEFEIQNTSDSTYDLTLCGVCENPFENGKNTFDGDIHTESKGIRLYSANDLDDDGSLDSTVNARNLYISTDFEDVSYQEYLIRGSFSDKLKSFCEDLKKGPSFQNRYYKDSESGDAGLVAAHLTLAPGEKKTVRFVISWYTRYVDEIYKKPCNDENRNGKRNYYCRFFSNSTECAAYCYTHWDRLKKETDLFSETLYSSTLKTEILECITSSLCVLKSHSFMRNKDGNIIDYKNGNRGYLDNWEYALCHLFPKLARGMRENEYFTCMNEKGALSPCVVYPLGTKPCDYSPYADGQLGSIVKTYREFIMCGDTTWLKKMWPYAKHCLDYAFKGEAAWDPDRTGIFGGYQKTANGIFDRPDPYTQGLYVCALICAADMANILKEKDIANEYRIIANKAKDYLNTVLFNGKDFTQSADYSFFNQLTGQWHGKNLGLEDILEKDKLISALEMISSRCRSNPDKKLYAYSGFPLSCLMLQNKMADSGIKLLQLIENTGNSEDISFLSSYTLINAAAGLIYNMHREMISFDPILDFSENGYFNCFFAAGEAFGTIEVGPKYIEMKLLCGQFKLRRFGLFKEPKVVYYGGRKFDFKAVGNTAVFDVSLILNKEKSIQVIFD